MVEVTFWILCHCNNSYNEKTWKHTISLSSLVFSLLEQNKLLNNKKAICGESKLLKRFSKLDQVQQLQNPIFTEKSNILPKFSTAERLCVLKILSKCKKVTSTSGSCFKILKKPNCTSRNIETSQWQHSTLLIIIFPTINTCSERILTMLSHLRMSHHVCRANTAHVKIVSQSKVN